MSTILAWDCQNDAAEIKLRAERRLGELTKEMEKNKGAATLSHNETASPPTYPQLGRDHRQVHRWQQAAELSSGGRKQQTYLASSPTGGPPSVDSEGV
jgi:hypothetical protein